MMLLSPMAVMIRTLKLRWNAEAAGCSVVVGTIQQHKKWKVCTGGRGIGPKTVVTPQDKFLNGLLGGRSNNFSVSTLNWWDMFPSDLVTRKWFAGLEQSPGTESSAKSSGLVGPPSTGSVAGARYSSAIFEYHDWLTLF